MQCVHFLSADLEHMGDHETTIHWHRWCWSDPQLIHMDHHTTLTLTLHDLPTIFPYICFNSSLESRDSPANAPIFLSTTLPWEMWGTMQEAKESMYILVLNSKYKSTIACWQGMTPVTISLAYCPVAWTLIYLDITRLHSTMMHLRMLLVCHIWRWPQHAELFCFPPTNHWPGSQVIHSWFLKCLFSWEQ